MAGGQELDVGWRHLAGEGEGDLLVQQGAQVLDVVTVRERGSGEEAGTLPGLGAATQDGASLTLSLGRQSSPYLGRFVLALNPLKIKEIDEVPETGDLARLSCPPPDVLQPLLEILHDQTVEQIRRLSSARPLVAVANSWLA